MRLYSCPACTKKIAFSAKVCPKCGHEVTAVERATARRLLRIGDIVASFGFLMLAVGVLGTVASNTGWLIAAGIGFVLLVAGRRR